jgi:hypothetical protein
MCSLAFRGSLIAGSILAGLFGAAPAATAQQKAGPPDFSWNNEIGWLGDRGGGPGFTAVPGRLPPVADDPAHPYVPNGTAQQPTYRIADLTNPNLKPWVKERMKMDNAEVLAGKIAFTARSSCMPAGVPYFMAYGGPNPIYFIQTPKQVSMIFSGDQQVRRIYLDVPTRPSQHRPGTASRWGTMRATPLSSIRSGRTTAPSSILTGPRTPRSCTS